MPRSNGGSNKGGANNGGKTPEFEKLVSFEVVSAKEGKTANGDWQLCTVKINGVTIYGCRAVTYTDKEGKSKDFLAFPERKGSDGKYYKHAYIALSQEDQQKICDAIWAKLEGK